LGDVGFLAFPTLLRWTVVHPEQSDLVPQPDDLQLWPQPTLCDSEVLTIEIAGAFLGYCHCLKISHE
jgi:hypothetical protein